MLKEILIQLATLRLKLTIALLMGAAKTCVGMTCLRLATPLFRRVTSALDGLLNLVTVTGVEDGLNVVLQALLLQTLSKWIPSLHVD